MPPRKKYDPDVWGPPPPLPPRASHISGKETSGSSNEGGSNYSNAAPSHSAAVAVSAFQRHFANRTEVVCKDNVNAHLGVMAAAATGAAAGGHRSKSIPVGLKDKEGVPKKKAAATFKIVAPSEVNMKPTASQSHSSAAPVTPPPFLDDVKTGAQQNANKSDNNNKLPPITSAHRVLNFDSPARQTSAKTNKTRNSNSSLSRKDVVEVDMSGSDSEEKEGGVSSTLHCRQPTLSTQDTGRPMSAAQLSRRSSTMTMQAPGQQVKCLMAPSALAAAAGVRTGVGNRRDSTRTFPFTPPPCSPSYASAHRPTSAASSSMSYSAFTPLTKDATRVSPSSSPPTSTATPRQKKTHQRTLVKQNEKEKEGASVRQTLHAPSETNPSFSAPSLHPSDVAQHAESRRPPASAEAHSKSPPSASSSSASRAAQRPGYKPYTLNSYKLLMADVASRKSGGLGPSDTDAQRAARAKLERARAYGRKAEQYARQSFANESTAAVDNDDPQEKVGSVGGDQKTQQCRQGHAKESCSASASSSESSTSSKDSSSLISSSSSSPTSGNPKSDADYREANNANGKSVYSTTAAGPPPNFFSGSSSPAAAPSVRERGSRLPAKSKPQRKSSAACSAVNLAGQAFAVAAASRKEAKEAQKRRARALAYARKIAQERQVQQEQQQHLRSAGEVGKGCASEHGDRSDDDVAMGDSVTGGVAAAVTAEERRRQQHLMDLEFAHAQKKVAVDLIRRQLRCGGNRDGG